MSVDDKALVDALSEAWGWRGCLARRIVMQNSFAHMIVEDEGGHFWHLEPDMCELQAVAANRAALDAYMADPEVQEIWKSANLLAMAQDRCGPLAPDRSYGFAIPPILGGEFTADNLVTVPTEETIRFSGDVAKQIEDLPDGAQVRLEVGD